MPSIREPANKMARYREQLRAAGMRPVQFWVPDIRIPEFAAKIRRQCQSLKNDPAETDVLHFTEEAAIHIEGWE